MQTLPELRAVRTFEGSDGPSASCHIVLSTTFEPSKMCLHFALSEVSTLSKNCKICRLSAVIDRLLARVPATPEGFTRASARFPNSARGSYISHTGRISRSASSPHFLQFLQILQILCCPRLLKLMDSPKSADSANTADSFDCPGCSRRLNRSGCSNSPRGLRRSHTPRRFDGLYSLDGSHRPHGSPGFDSSNSASGRRSIPTVIRKISVIQRC